MLIPKFDFQKDYGKKANMDDNFLGAMQLLVLYTILSVLFLSPKVHAIQC